MKDAMIDPQLGKLLHAIGVLCAVRSSGSFSAAAELLSLDQSAVSHRLRNLEGVLGMSLFRRTTRRVAPTRAGELLCEAAERALSEMARALKAARQIRGEGTVRLSISSSVAMKWLLPLLGDATKAGLDLALDVTDELADLDRHEVEAAIRFGPGPYPGSHSTKLTDCSIQPVASPGYLASLGAAADPWLCDGVTLLADRRGERDGTGFSWAEYSRRSGIAVPPGPMQHFDRADLMLQAAIGGMGIGLGRTLLTEEDLRQGFLVAVGPAVEMDSAYWLVSSHELAGSDRVRNLAAWLKARAATARGGMTAYRDATHRQVRSEGPGGGVDPPGVAGAGRAVSRRRKTLLPDA